MFEHATQGVLYLSSMLYKSALFLQNKANLRKGQMSVSPYNTKVYENIRVCRLPKSKANQSQFVFLAAENAKLAELLLSKDRCQCNVLLRH